MNEFHLPTDHELHLKTILAMDFGEKFIGLATYCVNRDPFPTPYGRIANKDFSFVTAELRRVIEEEVIDLLVVGLPHLLDGKKTSSTERAQLFADQIRDHFSLPLELQDETLSTFEAQSRMKASPRYNFTVDYTQIDAVAAAVILEDFIRHKK